MPPRRLALVTIGQGSRPDLTSDVLGLLDQMPWTMYGALDRLEDPAELAPEPGDVTLISRLRDGSSVRAATRQMVPLVDAAIARGARDGCTEALVLCTGHLAVAEHRIPVIHAEAAAHQAMVAQLGSGTLGVICPLPEQRHDILTRWRKRLGRDVLAASADPYAASDMPIADAARDLARQGADAILLDCMGYTRGNAALAADAAGRPADAARVLAFEAVLGAAPRASDE